MILLETAATAAKAEHLNRWPHAYLDLELADVQIVQNLTRDLAVAHTNTASS